MGSISAMNGFDRVLEKHGEEPRRPTRGGKETLT